MVLWIQDLLHSVREVLLNIFSRPYLCLIKLDLEILFHRDCFIKLFIMFLILLLHSKGQLDKLHQEISKTLEKIASREKYINNQVKLLADNVLMNSVCLVGVLTYIPTNLLIVSYCWLTHHFSR